MDSNSPYTDKDLRRALNLSALLGWGFFCMPFIYGFAQNNLLQALVMLPWFAGFGLPIAFASVWIFGRPILKHIMQKPITWPKAAIAGGTSALLIAAITIAIGRFYGWRQSLDPNSFSQLGGGDYVRSIDGILTIYGWMVVAQQTALFVLLGVTVGICVRWIIGSGRPVDFTNSV